MCGPVCLRAKRLDAGTALQIINNMVAIRMAEFGIGAIAPEKRVPAPVFESGNRILFFPFILCDGKKLHRFDDVNRDDVGAFSAKREKTESVKTSGTA